MERNKTAMGKQSGPSHPAHWIIRTLPSGRRFCSIKSPRHTPHTPHTHTHTQHLHTRTPHTHTHTRTYTHTTHHTHTHIYSICELSRPNPLGKKASSRNVNKI